MNPRNAGTEIIHPNNVGNYLDNMGNLYRLFSEIVFFKYENRLPASVFLICIAIILFFDIYFVLSYKIVRMFAGS